MQMKCIKWIPSLEWMKCVCARFKLEQDQQDPPLWFKLWPSAKLGENRTYQPKRSWVFRWELAVEGKNLSGLTEDTSFCFISLPNFSYISLNQQDNHSAAFRIVPLGPRTRHWSPSPEPSLTHMRKAPRTYQFLVPSLPHYQTTLTTSALLMDSADF